MLPTGSLRGAAALVGGLLALSYTARADFAPAGGPASGEFSRAQILQAWYSPAQPWTTLAPRTDVSGNLVDLTNGSLFARRVSDFGDGLPLNVLSSGPETTDDQVWTGGGVHIRAVARFAKWSQTFGYDLLGDPAGHQQLFEVLGDGMGVSGEAEVLFDRHDSWVWQRGGKGGICSSRLADNAGGIEHLLTYQIDGLKGPRRWVLFWDDPYTAQDFDYNDVVIEVTAIPEPAGAALLLLMALAARRMR